MMNRICAGALALSLLFPLAAHAQTPTTSSATSQNPFATKATSRASVEKDAAIKVLRKRVDVVDWNEMTLEGVFDWLREQGPINVIVKENELDAAGADPETIEITLSLKGCTVAQVLNEALEQVPKESAVRYRATGNTIKISTEKDFQSKLFVRVYDVTDILFRVPEFDGAPEIDLTQQQTGGGQGASSTGQPVFTTTSSGGGEQRGMGDQERLQRMDELRVLIELAVEPFFWDTVGGPGSIVPYNRVLMIRASVEIHEEIAGYFSLVE